MSDLLTIMDGIKTYLDASFNTYIQAVDNTLPTISTSTIKIDEEYNLDSTSLDMYLDYDKEELELIDLSSFQSRLGLQLTMLVGKNKKAMTNCIKYREAFIKLLKDDFTLGGLVSVATITEIERYNLNADLTKKDNAGIVISLQLLYEV